MRITQRKQNALRLLALMLMTAAALGGGALSDRIPLLRAAENSAATMQLTKTEGTVKISSGSMKNVPLVDNMRLYNGYQLDTREKSYAWIRLDRVKLAKLDAASRTSIRKKGKKLEILLDSGNLFFNITEPLKDDESLFIRTSTLAVGIRGTSGWVEIKDEQNVVLSILEGSVEITVTDPVSGESRTDTVSGGETVLCKLYDPKKEGEKCDIRRDTFDQDGIPGFVLKEVAEDAALAEKTFQGSGLDLRNLSKETVETRLREDEAAASQKSEEIRAALAQQASHVSTDLVWATNNTQAPVSVAESAPSSAASPTTPPPGSRAILFLRESRCSSRILRSL